MVDSFGLTIFVRDVERFDDDGERHRSVDKGFVDFGSETFGHQRRADEDKEGQRPLLVW